MKLITIAFVSIFLKTSFSEKILKIEKNECPMNPEFIANETCETTVNGNILQSNVDYDVIKPMKNMILNVVLYKFTTKYEQFLINEFIYLCDIINGKHPVWHYYVDKLYKVIVKYSNSIKCNLDVSIFKIFICKIFIVPLQPGHYYFRNARFNFHSFKHFIDVGRYKFTIHVYEGKNTVGNFSIFGNLIKK